MVRIRLVAALALCFALVLAADAEAGFAPANDEIATGANLFASDIATNPAGISVVVWSAEIATDVEAIRARTLSPGGDLGPVLELATGPTLFRPRLAFAPDGRVFVAWVEDDGNFGPNGIQGRWLALSGATGPLLTIAPGDPATFSATNAFVTIDATSTATVAWRDEKGADLGLRRINPDSTMGTTIPDITGAGGLIHEPRVVGLPNGSTLAVWSDNGIEANFVNAAGGFGAPIDVSTNGVATADPGIAIDSLGNSVVAWRSGNSPAVAVRARRLSPVGALVGAELEVDPAATGGVGIEVEVAADSADDFLISWNRQDTAGALIAYARAIKTAGPFAEVAQPISAPLVSAGVPKAALFDDGSGAIVWGNQISGGKPPVTNTLARPVDSLARPQGDSIELAPGSGVNAVGSAPALGFAALLTSRYVAGNVSAATVRRILPPPTCADSTATVAQGMPVVAPLSCGGIAPIKSIEVTDPPAHGRLGPFVAAAGGPTYTPDSGYQGPDRFSFVGRNDGGTSNPAQVTIAVNKDTQRPTIERLKLLRSRSPNGKLRYQLRLVFSEPATASVILKKVLRRPNGKRRLRKVSRVSVASPSSSPMATIPLPGKTAKRLRLGGRFLALAVATDLAGNASKPRQLNFRVPAPKRR